MSDFRIWERAKALDDIQRTYNFELDIDIPDIVFSGKIIDKESLLIRTRSAVLPGRTVEAIESYFGPTKQLFPGRINFTNTFSVQFEETEDQAIAKTLYSWQEYIMSIGSASALGSSKATKKSQIVANYMKLYMYKYGNNTKTAKMVVFKNAWLSGFDDVSLEYSSNDSVKYNATFTFDSWTLEDLKI